MPHSFALALVVRDNDEANAFFTKEPRHEADGTVVVFLDLPGNQWDLVQYRAA